MGRVLCDQSGETRDTGWRRPIGCLIFIGHFPQKSPEICGSLSKNNLQLQRLVPASDPKLDVSQNETSDLKSDIRFKSDFK